MKPVNTGRALALAFIYFMFSAIITAWFIGRKAWLYDDVPSMVLSGAIAGAKWLLQIIAALIFLKTLRWQFIKEIGLVCLVGSCALLIYYILPITWGFSSLTVSVGVSVLLMVFLYFRAVKKLGIPAYWSWSWVACLIVAIYLQLTVVFHVF